MEEKNHKLKATSSKIISNNFKKNKIKTNKKCKS